MIILLNRIMIIIDSLFRSLFNRFIKCESNKNILIVFHQVFGDSVLIQRSLFEYEKIFPKALGYSIKMFVRPNVHKFMLETMPLPSNIELIDIDFKLFLEDYVYYRKTIKEYSNNNSVIIVPGTSFSAEVFTITCNAKRKIGLVRPKTITKPFIMALYNRIAYTERVVSKDDEMIIQRHRRLINYLGGSDYRAELSNLIKIDKLIEEEKYCVFCVGASVPEKCWPIERFASVADYLIEKLNIKIHICGGYEDTNRVATLCKLIKFPDMVVSHIGNTTFSDWSSIVQNSSLLITNDSATAHIGAAARVKTICITGVYDGSYVFPYKVDYLADNDILPWSVFVNMPCEDCRSKGYFMGNNNPKCNTRIKNGQCTLCIDSVTVNDVITVIDNILKS